VAVVEALREFVIVLPEVTPVNVNTAPPEVLAAVIEAFSMAEANALVARRNSASWRDLSYFHTDLHGKQEVANAVTVQSSYFLVRSRVRLDRAALDAEALINRGADGRKVTTLVWVRQN
jgi:general secretion pathway protein K